MNAQDQERLLIAFRKSRVVWFGGQFHVNGVEVKDIIPGKTGGHIAYLADGGEVSLDACPLNEFKMYYDI